MKFKGNLAISCQRVDGVMLDTKKKNSWLHVIVTSSKFGWVIVKKCFLIFYLFIYSLRFFGLGLWFVKPFQKVGGIHCPIILSEPDFIFKISDRSFRPCKKRCLTEKLKTQITLVGGLYQFPA